MNSDPHNFSTRKKQIEVSFSCVCPVVDHEFRHNIVKIAVDPRGDSHSYFDTRAGVFKARLRWLPRVITKHPP